jgi:formylmethanofuran dehydrogenase subunit E
LSEEELFDFENVNVQVRPEDLPGYKGQRIFCAECGEGINFHREVLQAGRTLCRGCAGESYYTKQGLVET